MSIFICVEKGAKFNHMASIEQIIKDLEEIRDSGGTRTTGGGTAASRRTAALQAKEALANSKEFNKNTKQRLDLEIKALRIAQNQYKLDEKEYAIIGKQIKNREKQIETNEKFNEITKKVGQSFVGLGKAAFEGSGSISAFTDNIKGLGLLGNRLDVNVETFRQLSQSGANFGQSIVELRTAAANAALPLDDFAALVANNSQNLAALFGSTTEGAKGVALLGARTRELGIERLAPLGLTVDEINETLLLNLDSQRRTGILGRLTDQQRINSAIAFAEELDRLAKLTGAQRDELRAQIEQQQSNERFQAALQDATDDTRRRLQAFAGTVGNLAPNLNEGFQDLIANAGVAVTEPALQLIQNIPQAAGIVRRLISGTVSSEQALGQLKDAASASVNRFKQATVTGQVEFLALQGDVINLGKRIVNVDGVFQEQEKSATELVKGLTTFEQATKVLSSQFQQIETGLLQAFGPALGGFVNILKSAFGAGGSVATALAKAPGLTAGLLVAGLSGKVLFDAAKQTSIVAAGTRLGTAHLNLGGGGAAGMLGKAGGVAAKGVGGLAGLGIAAGGIAQANSAQSAGEKAFGVGQAALGGALTGAVVGSVIPVIGTAVGAAVGGALGAGTALFAAANKGRQFGGGMDAGKTYLVGEAGPEMITSGTKSTVTANADLKETFDTSALESKMASMTTELTNANKALADMVNGVNTLVAVESRALKAVEKTARKEPTIGMV